MMNRNPDQRPSISDLLQHDWFRDDIPGRWRLHRPAPGDARGEAVLTCPVPLPIVPEVGNVAPTAALTTPVEVVDVELALGAPVAGSAFTAAAISVVVTDARSPVSNVSARPMSDVSSAAHARPASSDCVSATYSSPCSLIFACTDTRARGPPCTADAVLGPNAQAVNARPKTRHRVTSKRRKATHPWALLTAGDLESRPKSFPIDPLLYDPARVVSRIDVASASAYFKSGLSPLQEMLCPIAIPGPGTV
jgi:hypothetical protein